MKVAFVVSGRFHIYDLARELILQGHEVTVFTNYPRWVARRFGVPSENVRSLWAHGFLVRVMDRLCNLFGWSYPEVFLSSLFGRWAARRVGAENWDVVNCMSGFAEELYSKPAASRFLKQVTRLSAHIRVQRRILEEEERRVGRKLPKPAPEMITREEREYALTDQIHVPSRFARDTFVREGVPEGKMRLIPLGTRLRDFRPPAEVIEERCARILSGGPLRVLYVGMVSYQKGMRDLAAVIRSSDPEQFLFRLVGAMDPPVKAEIDGLKGRAEWVPSQPQGELPRWYAWADLFLFPTLQDGYAMVLAQAAASGLPVITTPHCSGPDFLREGETGWIVPIRQPERIRERLEWCSGHRAELASMARGIYEQGWDRDWSRMARDFEEIWRKGR